MVVGFAWGALKFQTLEISSRLREMRPKKLCTASSKSREDLKAAAVLSGAGQLPPAKSAVC